MQETSHAETGAGESVGDSVAVRARDNCCMVTSVCAPFAVAYWRDLRALASELGLGGIDGTALQRQGPQGAFLARLAERGGIGLAFQPARVGYRTSPAEVRQREEWRRRHQRVVFEGDCARPVMLGALELVAGRAGRASPFSCHLTPPTLPAC